MAFPGYGTRDFSPLPAAPPPGKKWLLRVVLALSHVLVFALGVVGDVYVIRLWTIVAHQLGDGPLVVVDKQWPNYECSPATVAIPHGGPAPNTFTTWDSTQTDPIAAAGVALSDGELSLRLVTGDDDHSAYIYGLSLVPFRTDPTASPDWAAHLQAGGCGDAKIRLFDADLQKGTGVVDRGLVGGGDVEKEAPSGRLGPDFTVNAGDPAHIYVDVHACQGLYEFGLQVKYNYLGHDYADTVGSAAHPFKIIGLTREIPYYTYDPSTPPQLKQSIGPKASCGGSGVAVTAAPTGPAALTYAGGFEGTWTGQFRQDNNRTWAMKVRINAGATQASVEYPELGCSGTWTVVQSTGTTAKVRELITKTTGKPCTASGTLRLSLTSDGRVQATYVPDGATYSASAILTRQ